MAKISAYGEREFVRFEGPGGAAVVLTVKDGQPRRLLHRLGRDWGYTVAKKFRATPLDEAARYTVAFAVKRNYAVGRYERAEAALDYTPAKNLDEILDVLSEGG